jgi:flagellin-like hook-associated protein FlgL
MGFMIDGSKIALGRAAGGMGIGSHVPGTPFYGIAAGLKPSNLKADTFQLSYQAKAMNLRISGKGVGDEPAVSWEEQIKNSGADPKLKLLDKHIAKAGKILEQMKEIAKSALDETLSDSDRLALQMNMGRLQHELDRETEKLHGKYRFGEARAMLHEQNYEDTDAYKMLERVAERLANGEEWDVAEEWTPYGNVPENWYELDLNIDNVFIMGYGWEISDDPDAPTIGDFLKAKGRSVMDSEAAGVSAAELEKDIEKLVKRRDNLAAFVKKNGVASQTPETDDSGFTKAMDSLYSGLFRFLNTHSRNPAEEYNKGAVMNKLAEEYGYPEPTSEESHDIRSKAQIAEADAASNSLNPQTSEADEALMATVSIVQLNSKLSVNIDRCEVGIGEWRVWRNISKIG